MSTFTISPEYGYVLIAAALLVLEGVYLGSAVMGLRRAYFNDEWQKKNNDLMDEHKKAFPTVPFSLGYPDMGSGRYAGRLDYEQWFRFNNVQRGHHNFLEQVWGVMSLLLVGGLFQPKTFAVLATIYIVSRALYAKGYSSQGPKGREAGAILGILSLLGMVGCVIKVGVALIKSGSK
ncbi:mapeg family protein [Nannochloropsis gaditana]|uniref:Mapeg family protein n=1 Tax=Nannochloropsis gaditana TaxID=72520 RepID=W7U746_9STRA|nr:mapeg family protein [Nannochloropsis gaditana]